jgi:hypothetical protein
MKNIKDIQKQFKTQLGLKISYWNDLNKDKSIRRVKITGVYNLDYKYEWGELIGGSNHLLNNQNMNDYVSFIKNELGIDNVKTQQNKWGWNEIVFKLENK